MTLLAPSLDKNPFNVSERGETAVLRQQLVREISCLERQLERVRCRSETKVETTLHTYESMIEVRRRLLYDLACE
jgi:hypothetical protein